MTGAPGRLGWKKDLWFPWKKGQKYIISRILDLQCSDTCCPCGHHGLGDLFAFFFLGKRWLRNVHVLMPICPDSIVYLSIVSWNDLKNPPNIFLKPSLKRKLGWFWTLTKSGSVFLGCWWMGTQDLFMSLKCGCPCPQIQWELISSECSQLEYIFINSLSWQIFTE